MKTIGELIMYVRWANVSKYKVSSFENETKVMTHKVMTHKELIDGYKDLYVVSLYAYYDEKEKDVIYVFNH